MPNIVRQLRVDEVSLVDSPANASVNRKGKKIKHAVVAIVKRDAEE
jgi:hypothetical protein